jgi:hypothetical protein
VKADPAVQRRLLDLAEVDAELSRLAHRRRTLPEHAKLTAAEVAVAATTVRGGVPERCAFAASSNVAIPTITAAVAVSSARTISTHAVACSTRSVHRRASGWLSGCASAHSARGSLPACATCPRWDRSLNRAPARGLLGWPRCSSSCTGLGCFVR